MECDSDPFLASSPRGCRSAVRRIGYRGFAMDDRYGAPEPAEAVAERVAPPDFGRVSVA